MAPPPCSAVGVLSLPTAPSEINIDVTLAQPSTPSWTPPSVSSEPVHVMGTIDWPSLSDSTKVIPKSSSSNVLHHFPTTITPQGSSDVMNREGRNPNTTKNQNFIKSRGRNIPRPKNYLEGDDYTAKGGNNRGGGRGFGNGRDQERRSYKPQTYGHPMPFFSRPSPPPPPPSLLAAGPYGYPFINPLGFPAPPAMPGFMPYFAPPAPYAMAPPPLVLTPAPDLQAICKQVEYYFSFENLIRDEHLRKFMDQEGWVPVSLIAGFNRVKELTKGITNNIPCVLDALQSSLVVEIQGYNLRRRDDWARWILPPTRVSNLSSINASPGRVALSGS